MLYHYTHGGVEHNVRFGLLRGVLVNLSLPMYNGRRDAHARYAFGPGGGDASGGGARGQPEHAALHRPIYQIIEEART